MLRIKDKETYTHTEREWLLKEIETHTHTEWLLKEIGRLDVNVCLLERATKKCKKNW